MTEISETHPAFTIRRDAFEDEKTYEEFRGLVRAIEILRLDIKEAIADLDSRVTALEP